MRCVPKDGDNLNFMLADELNLIRRQKKLTSGNTQSCHEIVGNRPDSSLPLERCPVRCKESVDRNSNNESDIEPIDVFVPVGLGNRFLGDVRLLGIVSLVAIWL
jgi:hypothetical protein